MTLVQQLGQILAAVSGSVNITHSQTTEISILGCMRSLNSPDSKAPGSCRPQMGPMLAPGTSLSGSASGGHSYTNTVIHTSVFWIWGMYPSDFLNLLTLVGKIALESKLSSFHQMSSLSAISVPSIALPLGHQTQESMSAPENGRKSASFPLLFSQSKNYSAVSWQHIKSESVHVPCIRKHGVGPTGGSEICHR